MLCFGIQFQKMESTLMRHRQMINSFNRNGYQQVDFDPTNGIWHEVVTYIVWWLNLMTNNAILCLFIFSVWPNVMQQTWNPSDHFGFPAVLWDTISYIHINLWCYVNAFMYLNGICFVDFGTAMNFIFNLTLVIRNFTPLIISPYRWVNERKT